MNGTKYKHLIMRWLGIDELHNINKKRKIESNRLIRSIGPSSIIYSLTGRSYTPELDIEYSAVIRKRLIKHMDLKNIDEIDMAIAPGIVGSTRYELVRAFFNKYVKTIEGNICWVYESTLKGYVMQTRKDGMFIVRIEN